MVYTCESSRAVAPTQPDDWAFTARTPGSWGVSKRTLIQTERGVSPAGLLLAGDRVRCQDGTLRTVLAALIVAPDDSAMGPENVVIERGALGFNLPSDDIVLGRRQQIALTHPVLEDVIGAPTGLVEAGQLIGLPGIRFAPPTREAMVALLIDGPGLIEICGVQFSGFPADRSAIESLDIAARGALFRAVPRTRYTVGPTAFAPDMPMMMAREAWLAVESTEGRGRIADNDTVIPFLAAPESDAALAIARGSALLD